MRDGFRVEFTGLKELGAKLTDLPDQVLNRSVVRINKMVMAPVLSIARDLAPRGATGATLESLDTKTKVYKRRGAVFTIIGPTLGHQVLMGTRQATATERFHSGKSTANIWHDPVKTAHLVEFGHKGPHPAPAHPFISAAYRAQRSMIGPRYESAMRAEILRLVRLGKTT